MFPCLAFGNGYWWIAPIIMIAMMALCFFMMRGHARPMMYSPGFGRSGSHGERASDRPLDILNRKDARGEINELGYEEKKQDSAGPA